MRTARRVCTTHFKRVPSQMAQSTSTHVLRPPPVARRGGVVEGVGDEDVRVIAGREADGDGEEGNEEEEETEDLGGIMSRGAINGGENDDDGEGDIDNDIDGDIDGDCDCGCEGLGVLVTDGDDVDVNVGVTVKAPFALAASCCSSASRFPRL